MKRVVQVVEPRLMRDFVQRGFVLVERVDDVDAFLEEFVAQLKKSDLWPFASRLTLDNKARVPHKSCQDAVETEHLSLHFEMGLPIIPVEEKTRVHALLCLHIPKGERASDVATRLLPIDDLGGVVMGLEVGRRLESYVRIHGAGWKEHNSGRILCAGQLLDAVHGKGELSYMREHRIAEWFNRDARGSLQDGEFAEREYFKRVLDLPGKEKLFVLRPGDLLIVDNLRVAHGRKGRRPAEELVQYLFGVKDASEEEIARLRGQVAARMGSKRRESS